MRWLEESTWMEWKVVSLRSLYSDEWLDIRLADVELPGGRHEAAAREFEEETGWRPGPLRRRWLRQEHA
jgi:hypothetical protein